MIRYTILFLMSFAFELQAQDVQKLDWLVGKWERENVRKGRTAFEIWEWNDNGLAGMGITMQGSDTVFVEKLNIVEKEGSTYYVADVSSNSSPTYFKITTLDNTSFVSENPEHDFPKKIAYKLEGIKMTATISGDGKAIPFLFKKVD